METGGSRFGDDDRMAHVTRGSTMVERQVIALLCRGHQPVHVERRGLQRIATPYLMQLTPINGDGAFLTDETVVVVGKDITPGGLGFFHQQPLPYRRAIVTVELPHVGLLSVEVDVQRCRFTKLGWYESGGRLLRIVRHQGPKPAEAI